MPKSAGLVEIASGLVADGGVLRILHVVEWVPSVVEGTFVGIADPNQARTLRAESEKRLEEYAKACEGVRVVREVVEGKAAPVILEVAQRDGSDLIVMGTHGRAGLGHLLLGSTAEKVLHGSRCPVLTVRT